MLAVRQDGMVMCSQHYRLTLLIGLFRTARLWGWTDIRMNDIERHRTTLYELRTYSLCLIQFEHRIFRLHHTPVMTKTIRHRAERQKKKKTRPKHTILTPNGSLFKSHTHTQSPPLPSLLLLTNLTNKSSNSVFVCARLVFRCDAAEKMCHPDDNVRVENCAHKTLYARRSMPASTDHKSVGDRMAAGKHLLPYRYAQQHSRNVNTYSSTYIFYVYK